MPLKYSPRDQMFLGIQDFEFAQIQSSLPISNHFYSNFVSIQPKFHLNFVQISPKSNQICSNLINFTFKFFLGDAAASSSAPTAPHYSSGLILAFMSFFRIIISN